MILTPVDEHGNPIGPTVGGHSIEGLRAELARIPVMDAEAVRRLAEELGRGLGAALRAVAAAPSDAYCEPPRPYPSVVVGVVSDA